MIHPIALSLPSFIHKAQYFSEDLVLQAKQFSTIPFKYPKASYTQANRVKGFHDIRMIVFQSIDPANMFLHIDAWVYYCGKYEYQMTTCTRTWVQILCLCLSAVQSSGQ